MLRPRSVGEILDASFQFIRAHLVPLTLGTLLFIAPSEVLIRLVPEFTSVWTTLGNLIAIPAMGLAMMFVFEAQAGRAPRLGDVIGAVVPRFPALLLAGIISGLLTLLGLLLLIVPGVIAFARLFAMPAIVLAGGGVGERGLRPLARPHPRGGASDPRAADDRLRHLPGGDRGCGVPGWADHRVRVFPADHRLPAGDRRAQRRLPADRRRDGLPLSRPPRPQGGVGRTGPDGCTAGAGAASPAGSISVA